MMDKHEGAVIVIDDDQKIRDALRWLFESVYLNVVCFASAVEFLAYYQKQQRGCLIIDVRMPGMSGLELLEQLKRQKCPLAIIVITGHGDIPMAVRAMKAGAMDFILKPFNDQYLLEKIQTALQQTAGQLKDNLPTDVILCFETLTRREREIMALVVAGKLNKQIAHELSIALSTVELHRAKVMQKMHVKTLAQLVKYALQLESMATITEN